MNIRGNIITNVMVKLTTLPMEEKELIEETLIFELNKYEVEARCTAIAVDGKSPYKYLKRFLATKRIEGLSENSINRYREQNTKMIEFFGKPLDEITTDDLRLYLSVLKRDRKLSSLTLDGVRRCLSTFFSYLAAEDIIHKNPCLCLKKIKHKKSVRQPFTDKEVSIIEDNCTNDRDKALVSFLKTTGCRVSEVANIKINEIDFNSNEVVVLGKGNKERTVYFNNETSEKIRYYINHRTTASAYLFTGLYSESSRLTKNGIEQALKKIELNCGANGYKIHIFPHKFRHTFATNLLNLGVDLLSVSKLLGHSDTKVTETYCHIQQNIIKNKYMSVMT